MSTWCWTCRCWVSAARGRPRRVTAEVSWPRPQRHAAWRMVLASPDLSPARLSPGAGPFWLFAEGNVWAAEIWLHRKVLSPFFLESLSRSTYTLIWSVGVAVFFLGRLNYGTLKSQGMHTWFGSSRNSHFPQSFNYLFLWLIMSKAKSFIYLCHTQWLFFLVLLTFKIFFSFRRLFIGNHVWKYIYVEFASQVCGTRRCEKCSSG